MCVCVCVSVSVCECVCVRLCVCVCDFLEALTDRGELEGRRWKNQRKDVGRERM